MIWSHGQMYADETDLSLAITTGVLTSLAFLLFSKDIFSYNKEQASEDDLHNIITIAMHENDQSLEEALEWVAGRHRERVEHALATWPKALDLSFSRQVDEDLLIYIDHIMNWPRANDCWNFENGRYFGGDGLRIQRR